MRSLLRPFADEMPDTASRYTTHDEQSEPNTSDGAKPARTNRQLYVMLRASLRRDGLPV